MRPELAIDVDPNKALLAGLSVQEVAGYVRGILIGQEIGEVPIDETRSAPVVMSIAAGIENLESLNALPIGPQAVPLGSIAEVRSIDAPAQ
jgi:Cu/Ag efflux pump CusA